MRVKCVGVACAFVQVSMSTMTKQRVCERGFGKEEERRRELTKVRDIERKRATEIKQTRRKGDRKRERTND